jgi:hypothetical protein
MAGTADDFKAASAKDAVEETAGDRGEVDFEWVMRGFLSYYFPINHGWKGESDILLAVLPRPLLPPLLGFVEGSLMIVRCVDEFLELCGDS